MRRSQAPYSGTWDSWFPPRLSASACCDPADQAAPWAAAYVSKEQTGLSDLSGTSVSNSLISLIQ